MSDLKSPPTRTAKAAGATADYLDQRTGIGGAVKYFARKVFPDHWSFFLGEIALYSFVTLLISGVFLTLFFVPSMGETHYHGPWPAMNGVEMSEAFASTLRLSFEVRGGLLMRQIHHWAALIFMASIVVHMMRVFFTGAFRKPREINWLVGFVLLILGLAAGFSGYSLPDDVLSGNGLRITDGVVKAIPILGSYLSYFIFGGEFPGHDLIPRLFTVHILLVPGLILALVGAAIGGHLILMIVNKHTQFAGPGRTENNVVGVPIMPVFAAKAGGFFFVVFGVLMAIASTVTINPIWNYGPYDPSPVSAGTQPDWYIGFADGMLRLIPPHLESVIFGFTFTWYILIPIAILVLFIVLVAIYPFIEAFITGDKREHHIADRPRNAPTRTAIGAAGVTFYAVMWAAASSDLIATHFKLSIEGVTHTLQVLLIVGPIIAYFLAKRICLALQKKDREIALHGFESGRIVRLPGGEYIEVHEQLSDYERWRLVSYDDYAPLMVRPNAKGRITLATRLRAALSRWFFEDRIAPVTRTEIEASKHDPH